MDCSYVEVLFQNLQLRLKYSVQFCTQILGVLSTYEPVYFLRSQEPCIVGLSFLFECWIAALFYKNTQESL